MQASVYHNLNIFHAIVAEGSISAAARKLQSSPAAVSHSLKMLEQYLGLPLFLRSTRKLELTEAGQHLRANTQSLITLLEFEVDNIKNLAETPSGSVRITIPRFAFKAVLQPVYAEFCERYPHIQLEISVSDAAVDIVKEGFDLGIRCGDIIEENMVVQQLLPAMRDFLLISPKYAAKYGIPKRPADLVKHKMIGYRLITANRIQPLMLHQNGQDIEVNMPVSLIVNDELDVMIDATRQGLGIGRIYESSFRQQADQQDFIPILQDYWVRYPPIYLYYPQHSQKAKRVRVLIDFLMQKAV